MKKGLLIFGLIVAKVSVWAQDIPNGDFENWTTKKTPLTNVIYQDLDQWTTFDELLAVFGYPTTATKSEVSKVGDFSLQLMTAAYDKIGGGVDTTAGFATIGFAVDKKPLLLNGFYKSFINGPKDTMGILFSATKKNVSTGQSDVIGFGIMGVTSNETSFKQFNIPFLYSGQDLTPDSVHIVIASGGKKPNLTNGTTFWVDGLTITYQDVALGFEEENAATKISIYPNPAKDVVYLSNLSDDVNSYRIVNAQGIEEAKGLLSKALPELSLKGPKGMYMVELYSNNHTLLFKKKILFEGN